MELIRRHILFGGSLITGFGESKRYCPGFLLTRRDDNKIYADRLAAAGVATEFRRLDTIHGFMVMPVDEAAISLNHHIVMSVEGSISVVEACATMVVRMSQWRVAEFMLKTC